MLTFKQWLNNTPISIQITNRKYYTKFNHICLNNVSVKDAHLTDSIVLIKILLLEYEDKLNNFRISFLIENTIANEIH